MELDSHSIVLFPFVNVDVYPLWGEKVRNDLKPKRGSHFEDIKEAGHLGLTDR